MLKEIFAEYKRFEKCFFREDRTKDMISYIKLKHQFRSMMCFSIVLFVPALYILLLHHVFFGIAPVLLIGALVGFRIKACNTVRLLFFMLMMVAPIRYPSSPMVLVTPMVIFSTTIQVLIQTQSNFLTWIHIITQAIGFYLYGMDLIAQTIRGMSKEDLVKSARSAVTFTFIGTVMAMLCLKIFYAQFSSLLRKVNTLTESLSKANNQLNNQNLKLQSNLEMKDVFIYTFSHELKNALNGLLGNLTLAYDVAKHPQVIQHLSSAKVCGEILKNFIHNILDSGKLENGNLEVCPERRDVMNFMQSIWAICGKIIQNKRLKGSLEIEKNVPAFLDLDEQRMIQIILNLVSNAVKFTEKGHVRIHISWQTISVPCFHLEPEESQVALNSFNGVGEEREEEEDLKEFSNAIEDRPSTKENNYLATEYQKKFIYGSHLYSLNLMKSYWNCDEVLSSTLPEGSKGILTIRVFDSGCGMTPEDQARLFQKFSQVNQIAAQRKVGTGLGLWICKELAIRLEGDIKTRSMVGVGSVFELTIQTRISRMPKKPHNILHSLSHISEFTSPTRTTLELRPMNMRKILIADDDSFNIELMKNYLDKFGVESICAYDGEETVVLFKKHYKEIAFVITDNFMPKKTGTEAAIEIAAFLEENKQPKIPIMCISGDLKVSVGEKGITSVIQKPINFDRLKEELMTVYPQLTQFTN